MFSETTDKKSKSTATTPQPTTLAAPSTTKSPGKH